MIIKTHPTFKFALFFSAFFLRVFLFSQNNVLELLPGSEKIIYDEKSKKHRLIGTVNLFIKEIQCIAIQLTIKKKKK